MSFTQDRRSFVSVLASLAGLTVAPVAAAQSAAQSSSRGGNFDLTWLDQLKGRHKQVYDLGSANLAADPRPLRFARNFLDTFRDVYRLEFPDINTAIGISGPAFPMNASDRLWQKYKLGERSKIIDPSTKQPSVRNIFFEGGDISIREMQARGAVFWQCNVALGNVARVKRGLSVLADNASAEVADDDVQRHVVVRVADEVIVDLMGQACGLSYAEAARDAETLERDGVRIPVASPATFIRTKDTPRQPEPGLRDGESKGRAPLHSPHPRRGHGRRTGDDRQLRRQAHQTP